MTKQMFIRTVCLLGISVALAACKKEVEIVEVGSSIKPMTVNEEPTENMRKFSG